MNPRLLLLEDDPVSAAFLRHALGALPADVTHAGTLEAARRLARPDQALWLFDAQLPDGDGAALLLELRGRGMQVPALALTAADQPDELERLRLSGFARVLAKPVGAEWLRTTVREWLPVSPWDDAMAMAALGGSQAAMRSMRQLFLSELRDQAEEISAAIGQGGLPRAQAQLHRLKASCGFVGTPALLQAVQALSQKPTDPSAHEAFQRQVHALLG